MGDLLKGEILNTLSEEVALIHKVVKDNGSNEAAVPMVVAAKSPTSSPRGGSNWRQQCNVLQLKEELANLKADCHSELASSLARAEEQIAVGMRNLQFVSSLVDPSRDSSLKPESTAASAPLVDERLVNGAQAPTFVLENGAIFHSATTKDGHPRVLKGSGCCDINTL